MKMRTDKRELDKIYKRRDRYEIPDWQREEVWDGPRKQLLIDSILRGWKIPKFYFVKTSDSSYEVVDGQQRLLTIFEFLDGDLSLSKESAVEFGGSYYGELSPDTSDSIDDFVIDFDEITDASDEELKEFFRRLQRGLSLNSSEKLNSIHSKLQAFCKKTAKHNFFKKKVTFADKRYAYFDVVAKVSAVEIEGIDTGLRYDDVAAVFEGNTSFPETSATAKRIRKSLDFLDKSIPEGSKIFKNRSITQSVINLICAFVDGGHLDGKEQLFHNFIKSFVEGLAAEMDKGHNATDVDYLRFQRSVNANVKSAAATRHKVLLRKLFAFAPELLDLGALPATNAAGFGEEIARTSTSISELVSKINDNYAAAHGKDLFKPTNKTVTGLLNIGKIAKTETDFKTVIENLYFLFWEGHSGKIATPPTSFVDVNVLRTEFEHDVDHGGAGKFKAKKTKHAGVFEKYAGIKSPAAAGPERFPLAQLRLLQALEKDLKGMLT